MGPWLGARDLGGTGGKVISCRFFTERPISDRIASVTDLLHTWWPGRAIGMKLTGGNLHRLILDHLLTCRIALCAAGWRGLD